MADSSSKKTQELKSLKSESDELRDKALVDWADGGLNLEKTVGVEGEGSVTRRTAVKPKFKDDIALLKHCIENFEKMPFTVKWDDKKVVSLVEAGALSSDLVTTFEHYTISVKPED